MKNLQFFGAPHVALLFMAPVYETVRVAGDVGMFGQSLLLSLEAHGLGGVPQTLLSFFAGAAREVLGIDPMYKMLFGISLARKSVVSGKSVSVRVDLGGRRIIKKNNN